MVEADIGQLVTVNPSCGCTTTVCQCVREVTATAGEITGCWLRRAPRPPEGWRSPHNRAERRKHGAFVRRVP